ncbi:hypothetical protein ACFL35_12765 [Candidatus Riflebacteria bacterium]
MNSTGSKRKRRLFSHRFKCPSCNGKTEYLKFFQRDLLSAQIGLPQDFSTIIKIYPANFWFLAEMSAFFCDCGYCSNEKFTFKKPLREPKFFEKREKEKNLDRVLKLFRMVKEKEDNRIDGLVSKSSEYLNEIKENEYRFTGSIKKSSDSSSDFLTLSSLNMGNQPMPKIPSVENYIMRRNMHIKVENGSYSILNMLLTIIQDENAGELFEQLNFKQKVDANLSWLFNQHYTKTREFLFEGDLLWEKLKKLMWGDIQAFSDRFIFDKRVLAGSTEDDISDELLCYSFFQKISHKSMRDKMLNFSENENGDINGIICQTFINERSVLTDSMNSTQARVNAITKKVQEVENSKESAISMRSKIDELKSQLSMEEKNLLDFKLKILLSELQSTLVNIYFVKGFYHEERGNPIIQIQELDFKTLRPMIPQLLQIQRYKLDEFVRSQNIATAFTVYRARAKVFKTWQADNRVLYRNFRERFTYLMEEGRAKGFLPFKKMNPSQAHRLAADTLLFRNKWELQCDLFKGALADKIVYTLTGGLSILFSKIYEFLLNSKNNDSPYNQYLQRFGEHEADFRQKMLDIYEEKKPETDWKAAEKILVRYRCISRDYFATFRFAGVYKMLSIFWLEHVLSFYFDSAIEDFDETLTASLVEFKNKASAYFSLDLKIKKSAEDIEELKSLKLQYEVERKKIFLKEKVKEKHALFENYLVNNSQIKAYIQEILSWEKSLFSSLFFYNIKVENRILEGKKEFDPSFDNGKLLRERDIPFFILFGTLYMKTDNIFEAKRYFSLILQHIKFKKISDRSELYKLYEVFKELSNNFQRSPAVYTNLPEQEIMKEINSRIKKSYRFNLSYEE